MEAFTMFWFYIDGFRYNDNAIICRLNLHQTFDYLKNACGDSHIQCCQKNPDGTVFLNPYWDNILRQERFGRKE